MRLSPALPLFLTLLSLGFAACGDDDDDGGGSDQPQAFEVEVKEDLGQSRVTAPGTAKPGAVEIRFTNTGQQSHSLEIVEIGDGHTASEIKAAGEAWGDKGKPLPDWITFMGGIGSTKPGGSGVAVVELPAGEYAAFDIEGKGKTPYAEFTVEGDEGEGLPEEPAVIEATEYDFTTSDLQAGSQQVRFQNSGEEPHHVVAAPLKPGKTIDDVKQFIKTEKGEPPIEEQESFNTAIVSGGESQIVDLRLESGDYALLCFVPDRDGGPPHAVKGMAAVAKVE
jgi:hypothetical protein